MDSDTSSGVNQALAVEVGQRIRSHDLAVPAYCSICYRRIWPIFFPLREPAEAPDPQQSWSLCKGCYTAVLVELERSSLDSPVRVRVAAGIVAAERWPRLQRSAAEYEDRVWAVVLLWGFVGFTLLHLAILFLLVRS